MVFSIMRLYTTHPFGFIVCTEQMDTFFSLLTFSPSSCPGYYSRNLAVNGLRLCRRPLTFYHCSLKVSFSVIFERFTVLETFLYSRKCQTLGVSPAKPGGGYPLLIKVSEIEHRQKYTLFLIFPPRMRLRPTNCCT